MATVQTSEPSVRSRAPQQPEPTPERYTGAMPPPLPTEQTPAVAPVLPEFIADPGPPAEAHAASTAPVVACRHAIHAPAAMRR